ncbi:MAG TPA: DUF192 domain-containing protein [Candidatus Acidoferrum sp.]|nr:DUF192 domain-containing protein [Candidatus Acidoferrum sp.]
MHLPIALHHHPGPCPDPHRSQPGRRRGRAVEAPGTLRAISQTRGATIAEHLEVAGGLAAKFMGLMGRDSLPVGSGLWLPDSNGIHMMFMRFPIDAVFLGKADARGARPVVALRRALRPWTGVVWYVRGAHGVIELPVGRIDASGVQIGDVVRLEPLPEAAAV